MIRVTLTCIIMHDSFRCVKEVGRLIRLKTRVPVEGWGSVHWRLVLRFINAFDSFSESRSQVLFAVYQGMASAWLQPASAMPQGRVSLQGF
jgi:hypothetical protein